MRSEEFRNGADVMRTHFGVLSQTLDLGIGNIGAIEEGQKIQENDTRYYPPVNLADQLPFANTTIVNVADQAGISRAFQLV